MRWTVLGQWGARIVSLGVVVLLARLLTPEAFGLVAAYVAIVRFAQAIQGLGLGTALVQRPVVDAGNWVSVFWAQLIVAFTLTAALVAASSPLAGLVGSAATSPLLVALSFGVLLHGIGLVPEAWLARDLGFQALGRRTFVATLASAVAGVVGALLGWGAWALVAMELVRVATSSALLWNAAKWPLGGRPSLASLRPLLSYARSVLATDVLAVTLRRADDVIIGVLLGPVALGWYAVAYRVLGVATDMLARAASVVAVPVFSRVQGDDARLHEGFYDATRLLAAIGYPLFAILAVLADEFVEAVLGQLWLPSVPVVRYLALVGLLHSVLFLNTSLLLATGHAAVKLRLTLLDVAVTIPAFIVGSNWGIAGVAAGYLIANLVTTPFEVGAVVHHVGVSPKRYAGAVARPAALALLAAATAFGTSTALTDAGALARLLVAGSASLALTAVTGRLLVPEVLEDLRKIVRG